MRCSQIRLRRAVTLIDVVVLLGVGALLVPLVVPCVINAQEQGRIGQCLANLRTLGVANDMYLGDWGNEYPTIINRVEGTIGFASWFYGGKTTDEYWLTPASGVFYSRAVDRPFNPYLLGGRTEPDVMMGNEVIGRTEVPVLACPSDDITQMRAWDFTGEGIVPGLSTYDDVGTSYHWNYHAIMETNIDEWENDGSGWKMLVRSVLAASAQRQPDSFIWYIEGPLDYAAYYQESAVGFHGEMDTHSVGFRDGHAEYRYIDPTRWCGPGWELLCTSWVREPGSPEPAIYYSNTSKSCVP